MLYELIGVVRITHPSFRSSFASTSTITISFTTTILRHPPIRPAHPSANTKVKQVRPNRGVSEIKEIAKTTGNIVLSAGGVVRGITNWGTFLLPKPARKQGATYSTGHYFILRFDSSAKTQHSVRRTLGLDPRMIRYSVVKMGSKLEEIKDVAGTAEWNSINSGK